MEKKKIIAGAMLAVLAGGLGAVAGSSMFPKTLTKIQYETEYVNVPVEVPVVEYVDKIVVEKSIVEVDNGDMDLVLDHIYDNDGRVSYLTDDLDDDEVDMIVDRVVFINDIKALAVAEVEKEGIDELDKEVVNGEELDEDDIERFKIYDDDEDIEIDDVDFEDGDADVFVKCRFEHDDIDYQAVYKVEFKDNEVDDIDLEVVELRD